MLLRSSGQAGMTRLGERQENKVINLGKITLTGQISNKGEKNLGQINQPTN